MVRHSFLAPLLPPQLSQAWQRQPKQEGLSAKKEAQHIQGAYIDDLEMSSPLRGLQIISAACAHTHTQPYIGAFEKRGLVAQ